MKAEGNKVAQTILLEGGYSERTTIFGARSFLIVWECKNIGQFVQLKLGNKVESEFEEHRVNPRL